MKKAENMRAGILRASEMLYRLIRPINYRGFFDGIFDDHLVGWVTANYETDAPIAVEVIVDDLRLGTWNADGVRMDLKGPKNRGFSIPCSEVFEKLPVIPLQTKQLKIGIAVKGTNVLLKRSFEHTLSSAEIRQWYERRIISEQALEAVTPQAQPSIATNAEYRDLGAALFGPLLLCYYVWLRRELASRAVEKLFFLAREGYFLIDIFRALQANGHIPNIASEYLPVSRSLLFKALLCEPDAVELALEHYYSGSLEDLLRDRFVLSPVELEQLVYTRSKSIELPAQKDVFMAFYRRNEELLKPIGSRCKSNYLAFLQAVGATNGEQLNVVDVGYSGTIQKLLARILEKKSSVGFYFVTTRSEYETPEGQLGSLRGCFASETRFGEGCALLDKSIFLESVLSAPTGQLQDIDCVDDNFTFVYGPTNKSQDSFHVLTAMMQGAEAFVLDEAPAAMQWTDAELDRASQQAVVFYALQVKNGMEVIPSCVRDNLAVDDRISGNGTLDPAGVLRQMFGRN